MPFLVTSEFELESVKSFDLRIYYNQPLSLGQMHCVDISVACSPAKDIPEESQPPTLFHRFGTDVYADREMSVSCEVPGYDVNRNFAIAAQGTVEQYFPAEFDAIENARYRTCGSNSEPYRRRRRAEQAACWRSASVFVDAIGCEQYLTVRARCDGPELLWPGGTSLFTKRRYRIVEYAPTRGFVRSKSYFFKIANVSPAEPTRETTSLDISASRRWARNSLGGNLEARTAAGTEPPLAEPIEAKSRSPAM